MRKPTDFDIELDYVVTADGSTLGYLRARHWGDASAPLLVSAGDGEWHSTGRQVGDFSHSSDAAARSLFGDEVEDLDAIETE